MRVPRILQRVEAIKKDGQKKSRRNPGLVGPGIAKPKKKRADKLRALAGAFNVESVAPQEAGGAMADPFEAKYILNEQIGEGKQGVRVMRCTCRATSQIFAVKCIPKALLGAVYGDERHVLHVLQGCTNLISVHEVIETFDFLYYVLEYASGGDLFEYISTHGALSEDESRGVFAGILNALFQIHTRGRMFRDLKLENILLQHSNAHTESPCLSAESIRLADFEFCCPTPAAGPVGSIAYCAPEALDGTQPYTEAVDLWAAGIVLYAILSASAPFDSPEGAAATASRIRAATPGDCDFTDDCWDTISSSAKDLITSLLHPDPAQRMTLHAALAHPWFTATAEEARSRPKFSLRLGWHTKAKRWSNKGGDGPADGEVATACGMLVDQEYAASPLTCPLEWDPTRPRAKSL